MRAALFHPAAEAELHEAIAFFESRRGGLGLAFQAEVERVVELIREHPARWALHKDTGYRKCSLSRFPFNVFYLELEEVIWIAAVAHQKRRPGYWFHRKPM